MKSSLLEMTGEIKTKDDEIFSLTEELAMKEKTVQERDTVRITCTCSYLYLLTTTQNPAHLLHMKY